MAARIEDDFMSAENDEGVIATARYGEQAAVDGHGAWIVCGLPSRTFSRNQAITAICQPLGCPPDTAEAGLGQRAGHRLINSLRESTIGSWTRQTRGIG
jgi:hypothetical protein